MVKQLAYYYWKWNFNTGTLYFIKMPQGRRKTPFSGKAKKEQLKAKKQTKQGSKCKINNNLLKVIYILGDSKNVMLKHPGETSSQSTSIQKINFQPLKDGRSRPNRYALQFFKETNEELTKRKEFAHHSLETKNEKDLEIGSEDFFERALDFPKRPPWDFNLSKEKLEAQEQKYFNVIIF